MRKILAITVLFGLGGGAYAGDFKDLEVRAAEVGAATADIVSPAAPVPAGASAAAPAAYAIRCRYADAGEEETAQFSLVGTYRVADNNSAALTYEATITYLDDSLVGYVPFSDVAAAPKAAPVVFSYGKGVNNLPKYAGRKYSNHFKFPLEWHGVDACIDRADLIISKEPVSVEKDQYGAILRTFTGALDVSYNDHHGDFVRTVCVSREFER